MAAKLILSAALAVSSCSWAGAATARQTQQAPEIRQTTLGNVFIEGTTPTFEVANSGGSVTWSVTDFAGHSTGTSRESASGDVVRLSVPVPSTGFYTLTVNGTAKTTFAVLPRTHSSRQPDDFVYSTQTQFSKGWETTIVPLIKKAGVEAVRDTQRWADIEKPKGEYHFGRYETYMRVLRDAGLEAQVGLGLNHPDYDANCTPFTDAGQLAFARFAAEVVRHYGGQVDQIGVYNEPNRKAENKKCGDQADPARHVEITRAVEREVHAVDPAVRLAAPELAEGTPELPPAKQSPDDALSWLTAYAEALDHVDAVSVHTYRPKSNPRGPEPEGLGPQQIVPVRDLVGSAKPIWITEMGWKTGNVGKANQAAYLVRAHVLAMEAEVEKFNWYLFKDNGPGGFGLITDDPSKPHDRYNPKPSYVAYSVMTGRLAGLSYDGRDAPTPPGVQSHRFTGDAVPLRVMWTPGAGRTGCLATRQPVQVTDIMGRTETHNPQGGQVSLPLSGKPVFVRGDVNAITPCD